MKNRDAYRYESLMEKIDSLEETVEELRAKLNKMTAMWHNSVKGFQPTEEEKQREDKK